MTEMDDIRAELLMDLDETLEAEGHVPMYDFFWTLRGYKRGLTHEQMTQLSREAYDDLTRRTPMVLMWSIWPQDIDGAWAAEPGTELTFDMDPDGAVTEPYLILVPRSAVSEEHSPRPGAR